MHPEIPATRVAELPDPLPGDVAVLDVREPVEWEHGHIDGAVHVPLMQLLERIDEVPDGKVVVVCKVGGRSMQAVGYLRRQGYDAVNLDGGMVEWAGAGRPMLSENGRPAQVV
jgi:rhodanese-related sulfurtransferase